MIYYLSQFLWDKDSGVIGLDVSGSASLRRWASNAGQGCSHLKARLWLEGPLSGWLTHMTGMLVLVIGRSSIPLLMGLWELPEHLTAWPLGSPEQATQKPKMEVVMCFIAKSSTSHTISSTEFCRSQRLGLLRCREGMHYAVVIRRWGFVWAILEAGHHIWKKQFSPHR